MKKYFYLLLFLMFSSTCFAVNNASIYGDDYVNQFSKYYQQGLSGAYQYIDTHRDDEQWIDKGPELAKYGILSYSDDDLKPAYIEYKILCGKLDCGSVTVNLDGDDVLVPEGSTSGIPNYEVLFNRTIDKTLHRKNYRFSLFEQYAVSSNEISSIDLNEKDVSRDQITKKQKIIKDNKKNLNSKKLVKDNSFSVDALPSGTYNNAGSTDVYVPGVSTADCPSRTPCYNQFMSIYSGTNCYSGCAPTAGAIIMGYHDRNTKPNLMLFVTAPMLNDVNSNNMINSVRAYMATNCTAAQLGATSVTNIMNGINYAVNNSYPTSTSTLTSTSNALTILSILKTEINAGRPAIIYTTNHALVSYGYNSASASIYTRVNYGWGPNYANKDVSISSIFINSTLLNQSALGVITYKIQ